MYKKFPTIVFEQMQFEQTSFDKNSMHQAIGCWRMEEREG